MWETCTRPLACTDLCVHDNNNNVRIFNRRLFPRFTVNLAFFTSIFNFTFDYPRDFISLDFLFDESVQLMRSSFFLMFWRSLYRSIFGERRDDEWIQAISASQNCLSSIHIWCNTSLLTTSHYFRVNRALKNYTIKLFRNIAFFSVDSSPRFYPDASKRQISDAFSKITFRVFFKNLPHFSKVNMRHNLYRVFI